MRLERLTPALAPAWDAFVERHRMGWFFHTSSWIQYEMARGDHDENLSFAVLDDDGRIVAVCPLLRQGDRCTFEGAPGPLPLHTSCESASAAFGEVKRLGISAAFRTCPLLPSPRTEGFTVGWQSRVVDLAWSADWLHANLRKSYKALINKGEHDYQIVVDHDGDLDLDYKLVHLAAGARPRPAATYDMQERWIREGRAFLVGAVERWSRKWAAFAYIFTYKYAAYYGSGPSVVPGVMHAVLWRAILEAKAIGCEKIELGWDGHAKDKKGKAIEFFKAGFCKTTVPVYVMELAL